MLVIPIPGCLALLVTPALADLPLTDGDEGDTPRPANCWARRFSTIQRTPLDAYIGAVLCD